MSRPSAPTKTVYTRTQRGHSVTKHILLGIFTCGLSLPWTIYYAASPNHFFHS